MNTKEILQGIKDWAAPKVIYDISAAHNSTKYADLSDALGTDGGNIPQEYRKGGITVRYVRSSDNKYVQYFCNSQSFTTNVVYWEKVNLEQELSLLHNEIGDNVDYSYLKIVGGGYIKYGGNTGIKSSSTSDLIQFFPCTEGQTYRYEGNSGNIPAVYGYASTEYTNSVELVSRTNGSALFEIPNGVHYICAWSRNSTHETTPSELHLYLVNSEGIKQKIEDMSSKTNTLATEVEHAPYSTSVSYGSERTALKNDILHGERFIVRIHSIGCSIDKLMFYLYDTDDTTKENYQYIAYHFSGASNIFVIENSSTSEYQYSHSDQPNFTAKYIRFVKKVSATLDEGETWSVEATIESNIDAKRLIVRVENLEESPLCYNGYSIPKNPSKLKILSIGNSFIQYPMRALNGWLSSLGITDVEWGMCIKGGYSLKEYWDDINNNTGVYDFVFMTSNNNYNYRNYVNAKTGEQSSYHGYASSLKDCILFKDWDIISFQQASIYSGKKESLYPYLNKLIEFSRYYCLNSGVKIVWQQTWAAASDCTDRLIYYNNSQQEMLNGIIEVSHEVKNRSGLDLIIPSGIVIENLRNVPSSFWSSQDIAGDEFMDSTKYHPNDISIYAICGAWIQMLVLNSFGGTIRGCNAVYTGVSGNDAAMARQCVLRAIGSPYSKSLMDITNIE